MGRHPQSTVRFPLFRRPGRRITASTTPVMLSGLRDGARRFRLHRDNMSSLVVELNRFVHQSLCLDTPDTTHGPEELTEWGEATGQSTYVSPLRSLRANRPAVRLFGAVGRKTRPS